LAVRLQVPAATLVTVEPATVQILAVVDANTTGLPDPPPVAVNAKVPPVLNKTGVAGVKPVMVCAVSAFASGAVNSAMQSIKKDRNGEVVFCVCTDDVTIYTLRIMR